MKPIWKVCAPLALFVTAAGWSGAAAATEARSGGYQVKSIRQAKPEAAWGPAGPVRTLSSGPPAQGQPVVGTFLTSGDTVTFQLPAVAMQTIFNEGYRIFVPAGATQLQIDLDILTPDANIDLFVRFGQDVVLESDFPVADFDSIRPGDDSEMIVVDTGSDPPLQSGFYFIALGLVTTGAPVFGAINASVTGGNPQPIGTRLTSGVAQNFSIPPVDTPSLAVGQLGFRIDVPAGASQLRVRAAVNDPSAQIRLFLRHGFDIASPEPGQTVFDHSSPGGSNIELVTVSTSSSPPLLRGTYWIAFGLSSLGTAFNGAITATVIESGDPPPSLGVSRTQLVFDAVEGMNPPNQTFGVSNEGGGTVSFTVSSNQPWVTVSPTSGSSSGVNQTITVSVNTSGRSVGSHNAAITVEDTGSSDTAAVSVVLNVSSSDPPVIELSTTELTFSLVEGSPPTNPENVQSFTIGNGGGGEIDFRITSNQFWLQLQPAQGRLTSGEATVNVIINPQGLSPGTHMGELLIEDTDQGLEATVFVTLELIANEPVAAVTIDSLRFNAEADGGNPPAQVFSVANSGTGSLDYVITATEDWISVSPSSGTVTDGFDAITVTVDISGLEPGANTGEVVVSEAAAGLRLGAAQANEARVTIIVDVVAAGGTPPEIRENAVVNAASFVPFGQPGHAMSPGQIVSIFGLTISGQRRVATTVPLPVALQGVSVTFDGLPAPLFFVSERQVNAQLPSGLTGATATLVVRNGAGASAEREIQTNPFSPGLFTFAQNGMGQGIVTFANTTTLVAPRGLTASSRPAQSDEFVTIWCTGLGPVDPPIEDGTNSFDPEFQLRTTVTQPEVLVGGITVEERDILFSGLAPEFVGLYQVNIRIRDNLPRGDAVSLQLRIGEVESRPEVTFALE